MALGLGPLLSLGMLKFGCLFTCLFSSSAFVLPVACVTFSDSGVPMAPLALLEPEVFLSLFKFAFLLLDLLVALVGCTGSSLLE